MIYKVVFDNGKKGVMVVADGKGDARKKAKAKYGIEPEEIVLLGPNKPRGSK